jgi:hypothetical protein
MAEHFGMAYAGIPYSMHLATRLYCICTPYFPSLKIWLVGWLVGWLLVGGVNSNGKQRQYSTEMLGGVCTHRIEIIHRKYKCMRHTE